MQRTALAPDNIKLPGFTTVEPLQETVAELTNINHCQVSTDACVYLNLSPSGLRHTASNYSKVEGRDEGHGRVVPSPRNMRAADGKAQTQRICQDVATRHPNVEHRV